MRRLLLPLLLAVLLAGCSAEPTPTPEGWTPPPPTPTPTATATPLPPTPTPTPFESLCDPADPDCHFAFERIVSPVAWDPTLNRNGMFRAEIEMREELYIHWPPQYYNPAGADVINLHFYQDNEPIGMISPPVPLNADWDWDEHPGQYVADTFESVGDDLIIVEAVIDPLYGDVADEVCIWNGPDLLDCTEFEVLE